MKTVAVFAIYALALFNVYIWMILPEIFYNMIWKWDIFVALLFAPIIMEVNRNERKLQRDKESV